MNDKELAAVKQALEFVKANHSGGPDAFELITALQSIISQNALDKKAENARELGLDYEPAPVQGLPFGVGGGLVAIKTLLSRELCIHANTAIGMIDAILKEHPVAPKPWVGLTDEEAQWIYDNGRTPAGMMEMVEAKLKEKNHG